MINKILKMQMLEDDEELRSIGKGASVDRRRSTMAAPIGGGAELMIGGPEARPQWMRTLQTSVDVWLGTLPRVLQTFERTADALRDPLFRFFDRELNAAARLLVSVRRDLDDILSICQGVFVFTLRSFLDDSALCNVCTRLKINIRVHYSALYYRPKEAH